MPGKKKKGGAAATDDDVGNNAPSKAKATTAATKKSGGGGGAPPASKTSAPPTKAKAKAKGKKGRGARGRGGDDDDDDDDAARFDLLMNPPAGSDDSASDSDSVDGGLQDDELAVLARPVKRGGAAAKKAKKKAAVAANAFAALHDDDDDDDDDDDSDSNDDDSDDGDDGAKKDVQKKKGGGAPVNAFAALSMGDDDGDDDDDDDTKKGLGKAATTGKTTKAQRRAAAAAAKAKSAAAKKTVDDDDDNDDDNNNNNNNSGGGGGGKTKSKKAAEDDGEYIDENDDNYDPTLLVKDDMTFDEMRHALDNWSDERLDKVGLPPSWVKLTKFMEGTRGGGNDVKQNDVSITVPGKTILHETSLTLTYGKKYGLVGKNNIGKSVLLNYIKDRKCPIANHLTILLVEQEVAGTTMTCLETVIDADKERNWLLAEEKKMLAEAEAGKLKRRYFDLDDLYDRLRQIGSDSAVGRARAILEGLSFSEEDLNKPTTAFSGGWRMRIALARALFFRPDILLLDEPTNHLDLYALVWLESYLVDEWKKTLVIASHERDFLDGVVDAIIHIEDQKLNFYHGDYAHFDKIRKAKRKERNKKATTQAKAHAKAKASARQNKNQKQGASLMKKIGKEEKITVQRDDKPPRFDFPEPLELPDPIQFKDVTFGYSPNKILFRDLDFGIDMTTRIGLVGPNGAGKSTLMNLMTGKLEPVKGEIVINRKLRVAMFTQHHVEKLDLEATSLQYLAKLYPNENEQAIYNHIARFGLPGQLPRKQIKFLSGGHKTRIALAALAWEKPQILLLDEPSNHLDLETIDALVKSIKEYKGGVVMISHNTRLLSQCCDQIWIVKDQGVVAHNGAFEDYKQELMAELMQRHDTTGQ